MRASSIRARISARSSAGKHTRAGGTRMSRKSIEAAVAGPDQHSITGDLLSAMTEARHVVLMGLMGSGKSTVGRPLAARLDRPFVDNDDRLAARTGQTAREVAAAEGADALHAREAAVLVDALA